MSIINLTEQKSYWCSSSEDILARSILDCHHLHHLQHDLPHLHEIMCRNSRFFTPFCSWHDENYILHIFEQIPIFLVDKTLSGKSFRIGLIGRGLDITVPYDRYATICEAEDNDSPQKPLDDLIKELENGICTDIFRDEEIYPEPDILIEDNDSFNNANNSTTPVRRTMVRIDDLLGIYLRKYPANRPYNMTESQPLIFVWVDKIAQIAKDESTFCKALLAQVIAHELMHAVMDIHLLGDNRHRNFKIKDGLYHLKEECLANALSLMLIKYTLSDEQNKFVADFVKTQPFAYKLGLDYAMAGELTVERAFMAWMRMKESGRVNQKILMYWLNYLNDNSTYDGHQLELYEEGMDWPNGVYRYQSEMYSNHEVAVKVIKDFHKKKQGKVSRQEMKVAFPDSLNDYHNVFIDYPESNEFMPKIGSGTRPVYDENVISCQDGKLVVCDYWHPESMPAFIKNAKQLGFDIEAFD